MVQVWLAGEVSVLFAASVARTSTVWEPTDRPVQLRGEVQVAHAPPSIRHSNVEPASEELKATLAEVSVVPDDGAEPIVVFGAVVSAGGGGGGAEPAPIVSTSCGGLSGAFSREWKPCSMPPLPSVASRSRNPLFVPEYIPWTSEVTFHCIQPALEGVLAVAAVPVVTGWLAQVTPPSVQAALARSAWIVRPLLGEPLKTRSVAPVTVQPEPSAGSVKRMSARALAPDLLVTFRTESVP